MRKFAIVGGGLLLSLVLGATVFSEPIAWAAQSVSETITGTLDGQGNVDRVTEAPSTLSIAAVRDKFRPARSTLVATSSTVSLIRFTTPPSAAIAGP